MVDFYESVGFVPSLRGMSLPSHCAIRIFVGWCDRLTLILACDICTMRAFYIFGSGRDEIDNSWNRGRIRDFLYYRTHHCPLSINQRLNSICISLN
jgi:hypothetical protein